VNEDGDHLYAQRLVAADGATVGYFYVVQRREAALAKIFSSVAFVSFLVITGAILTLIVIYFLLARVLRPIRALRDAAEHIEKERYDVRIDYKGTDELGELAASFNRMQDTIARRTGELKTALREQQDFVDHTARELRNPVNIFRWTLELMRFGDTGRLNKDQLELLEQLHQTNERLLKVVQNLQDAVRIDQGKFTLKFRTVVMEDVIDEVAGMVAVRARGKGVTLHWNRPSKPLPAVRADSVYLLKIVHNLVSNAVKYTLKGGHVEVAAEVVDEASPGGKKGTFVRVNIEDNGIGIPQAEQGHIFERFYRAKNAIEGEIQGTGLGLFIAKHVIERHGGAVWFRSREEVGTTFSITIPIDDVADHHAKKS
jgi:signal transduction histidine kinase